ncbi:MAG: tRNA (N(6)-L-threonylcarbamoyladenosine(37)-C(2))-methylthiotransferase MtaB [Lachnospiraceae bacterium]|nr:tRNA (N(6)-L-threonylcarbamoyladenosine(37)-C(2))-methylthiotransferase MtaB [Lachnospiraceae bacterium]
MSEKTKSILNNKRIATLTLGCKVNQYETDGMRELLEHVGAELVDFEQKADIYLVNTCSVTNMAERKSRQMLHRAKKCNPQAIVVAVGCYVQTMPEEVLKDLSVDLVVGNNRKKDIVGILEQFLKNRQKEQQDESVYNCQWVDINQKQAYENLNITHMSEHTRAYIKIQDGCNQFCSYCIIPYVRGRIRSRKPEEIIQEVKKLAEAGCKEVVMTGIHLSSYGKDWKDDEVNSSRLDGTALLELLQAISEIDGILRIRMGSLEPRIMTEEFVAGLQKLPKVCPHFHLSLQSACNETLKRMNRKYTIEEYMESCDRLRKAFDRPALTTDVIVGFPGETQEEFETTCRNLEQLNLYEMHIFKYSKRRGTVAETMPNQVAEEEKNRRSDILLAMTARQKQAYEDSFKGESLQVLIEERIEKDGENWYVGHTERYMKVEVKADEEIINQVYTCIG